MKKKLFLLGVLAMLAQLCFAQGLFFEVKAKSQEEALIELSPKVVISVKNLAYDVLNSYCALYFSESVQDYELNEIAYECAQCVVFKVFEDENVSGLYYVWLDKAQIIYALCSAVQNHCFESDIDDINIEEFAEFCKGAL